MFRRDVIPAIALAVATTATAWVFAIDVRGGHGQSTKPGLNCEPCSDPCVDEPNVNTTCVDRKTGESFLATYACCCCNDRWKHRKVMGPKQLKGCARSRR